MTIKKLQRRRRVPVVCHDMTIDNRPIYDHACPHCGGVPCVMNDVDYARTCEHCNVVWTPGDIVWSDNDIQAMRRRDARIAKYRCMAVESLRRDGR